MRRFLLSFALATWLVVIASSASAAAHPDARGDASQDQFVIGTIQFPDGTHGTSFAFHVPASQPDILTYGLAVRFDLRGPKGWNHGHTLVTKCVQISPESLDTCDNWVDIPPVAGDYTAEGAQGATWTAAMDLTPVTPPQALSARPTPAGLAVTWRRGTYTGAYYIEVDQGNRFLASVLVAGDARKHLFRGLKLKTTAHYFVVIDAYPTNITKDIRLLPRWAISATSYYLTAP